MEPNEIGHWEVSELKTPRSESHQKTHKSNKDDKLNEQETEVSKSKELESDRERGKGRERPDEQ